MNSLAISPSVFFPPASVTSGGQLPVSPSGQQDESEVAGSAAAAASDGDGAESGRVRKAPPASATDQGLSQEELEQLTELKALDQEVRAHEAAHQAAGGQHAGAVSFTYERGPDGVNYAVAGEVSVDVSPVSGDPAATIDKMRVVRAAALAPSEPSAQDRAVAAQAMQTLLQAQSELIQGEGSNESASAEAEEDGQAPGAGSAPEQRNANETYLSVSQMNGRDQQLSGTGSLSVSA